MAKYRFKVAYTRLTKDLGRVRKGTFETDSEREADALRSMMGITEVKGDGTEEDPRKAVASRRDRPRAKPEVVKSEPEVVKSQPEKGNEES